MSSKQSNPPSQRSLGRASFTQGFAFGTVSFLIGGTLAVVTGIVTARLYGIHVVGQYALAYAPTGAVWYLSTAREQPALVKTLSPLRPGNPQVTGLFTAVFVFSTALTAVVAGIAVLATWLLFNGPIDHPELFLPAVASLAGYLVFTNPGWNIDTVMTAFRAGRQLFWIRLHQALAFLLFVVIGHFVLASVWGIVVALIASFATSLIHRLIVARHWIRVPVPRAVIRAGFSELPTILRFGLKITPGFLASGISNETGTWILGIVSSVSVVGAYSRAWSMSQRFLEANFRITEMLFPTLVERHGRNDHTGFDRALVDSIRYVAVGLLLPAAVAGGAAKGVMSLYGPGFAQGSTALAILLVLPALLTTASLQTHALLAVNRPLATTVVSLFRAAATIGSGIVLSLWLGIAGMAIAMVLGGMVQFVMQYRATRPHIVTPLLQLWPARQILGLAAAYAFGFAASHGLDGLFSEPVGLILGLAGGTVVYGATLVLVGGLAPRDRERARKVVLRVRSLRGEDNGAVRSRDVVSTAAMSPLPAADEEPASILDSTTADDRPTIERSSS
jgi:O-antigen/teichoic acid export membrane protein